MLLLQHSCNKTYLSSMITLLNFKNICRNKTVSLLLSILNNIIIPEKQHFAPAPQRSFEMAPKMLSLILFLFLGISGIIWFIFWAILVYESPGEHRYISSKELQYLKGSKEMPQKVVSTI